MSAVRIVRKALEGLSPMKRLYYINLVERSHDYPVAAFIDRNVRRSNEYAQLEALAEGQHVAIWVWQRDCDCAEGTSRRLIRPTKQAYDQMVHNLYLGAEGPVSWSIHRPSEPFEAYTRDRVLEAFENGSSYSV